MGPQKQERRMCVFMRSKEGKKGRKLFFSLGAKMSNRNEAQRLLSVKPAGAFCFLGYWVTRQQLKESREAKVRATE